MIGVPTSALAVGFGAYAAVLGTAVARATSRRLIFWGGLSTSTLSVGSVYMSGSDFYLQSALLAVASGSMGSLMALHLVRSAGAASAQQLLVYRAATGGCGVVMLDQMWEAFCRRNQ